MTKKFLSISEAAEELGVSPSTLRRWEREGKITSPIRTPGNVRRYDLQQTLEQLKGGTNQCH
jgi:putative resolvase